MPNLATFIPIAEKTVTCKVCDEGTLSRTEIFIMSPAVVTAGTILALPAIGGIILGFIAMLASATPKSGWIATIGIVGGIVIVFASFAGGLVSWVCLMKRKILFCDYCCAVTPAHWVPVVEPFEYR